VSDYRTVADALASGADPDMICMTCPWDRYCITPPTMTKAEVDAARDKAQREDKARVEEAKAKGEHAGMPVGSLLTALTIAGRDLSAQICPVLALRLRTQAGRGIVDNLKATMQAFDSEDAS